METAFLPLLSACFLLATVVSSASPPLLLGVHPLDEYFASEVINCKDGSKAFDRARLNDNCCDCPDGTDEPGAFYGASSDFAVDINPVFLITGTPPCPAGKFYDRNLDCCDGTDEHNGSIRCPNTCVMGGNLAYKIYDTIAFSKINEHSTVSDLENIYAKETKSRIKLDDLIRKLIGLKAVVILPLFLISCVVAFRVSQGVPSLEEDVIAEANVIASSSFANFG